MLTVVKDMYTRQKKSLYKSLRNSIKWIIVESLILLRVVNLLIKKTY